MTLQNYRGRVGMATVIALGIALVLTHATCLQSAGAAREGGELPGGAILFSSLAPRGWDIYVTNGAPSPAAAPGDKKEGKARRLTSHRALDYNAAFSPDGKQIAFASERDGNLELYVMNRDGSGLTRLTHDFALDDHPTWSPNGRRIAFCSTRESSATPGQAWNAIYVMNADGSDVRRLSPEKIADYSPAWSPKGDWIACASGSGVPGGTDLYLMRPNGGERQLVVKNGGWPTFAADGGSLYFHRRQSGKWGIWQVKLDGTDPEKITPDDVDAYTPRAATKGKSLVMAVRRGKHRQIERFDLATKKFTPLTSEAVDHWNPSISVDGQVVYHRAAPSFLVPNVELWSSPPGSKVQMLRIAGAFPAISPDNKRVALTGGGFSTLDVMNIDGSDRKVLFKTEARGLFSLSWAHTGNRIAFSHGKVFQDAGAKVEIETIAPDGSGRQTLTDKTGNNGFPSFAPDGKQLVFRSGRDGSKNLYIMNRDGSRLRRLTEGKWTDTMADWSPTGEWIAFASDRGGKSFEIWLIKPDGTDLKKLIGGGGRHNHPHFSPDGQWIVFTSQRAGLSAEEISLPYQPQPYGDLFAIRLDGTGLIRLTHNGFEEGTPAWCAATGVTPSKEGTKGMAHEY